MCKFRAFQSKTEGMAASVRVFFETPRTYKTHMEVAIYNSDLTKFEKEWGQFLPLVNSIDV